MIFSNSRCHRVADHGKCQEIDLPGAGGKEGPGASFRRRPGGHHIVNQQHATAAQFYRSAASHRKRIAHVSPALGRVKPDLRPRRPDAP